MQERGSDSSHTDTPHPSCTAAGAFTAAQSPLHHLTPNYPRVCTSGGLPGTATTQLPPEQAGPASSPGPTMPMGTTLALTIPHFCSGEETAGAGTQDEHRLHLLPQCTPSASLGSPTSWSRGRREAPAGPGFQPWPRLPHKASWCGPCWCQALRVPRLPRAAGRRGCGPSYDSSRMKSPPGGQGTSGTGAGNAGWGRARRLSCYEAGLLCLFRESM